MGHLSLLSQAQPQGAGSEGESSQDSNWYPFGMLLSVCDLNHYILTSAPALLSFKRSLFLLSHVAIAVSSDSAVVFFFLLQCLQNAIQYGFHVTLGRFHL